MKKVEKKEIKKVIKKKKKYKLTTTLKQKKAIKNLIENGGNKGQALRDASYSESVIKNPSKVFGSPTVQEHISKYLPDDFVLQNTKELVEAKTIRNIIFPSKATKKDIENTVKELSGKIVSTIENKELDAKGNYKVISKTVTIIIPSNSAKKNGIDISCKIKGMYAPEKRINLNAVIDLSHLSDEELDGLHKKAMKIRERELMYPKDKKK